MAFQSNFIFGHIFSYYAYIQWNSAYFLENRCIFSYLLNHVVFLFICLFVNFHRVIFDIGIAK